MLDTTPFSIVIGAVLGFLTGLGTGGGSLLVLWLTLVLHMDPAQARLINLMFFLPAAVISTILHWKQGRIPLKKVLLPTIAGCITAAVLSFVGQKIDTENLKKFFGVLLIFTGLRELFYRPRKPK
jgi:uncharacterized membrane protein YfcA